MGNFFKENWVWILAPIVIVLLGILALFLFGDGGNEDQPFTYTIW